jgi:hypothetical protein
LIYLKEKIGFLSVLAPEIKEVNMGGGTSKITTLLIWNDKDLHTYTYDLKLLNYPTNVKYCFFEAERINSKPCLGCTGYWTIEGLKLKTKIENGICRFNYWEMVEPEKATYKYVEMIGDEYEKYYSDCKSRNCWELAIVDGWKVEGKLTLLYEEPIIQEPTAEEQISEEPTTETKTLTTFYELTEKELDGKIYLSCKVVESCSGENCFDNKDDCLDAMEKRIDELKEEGKEAEKLGLLEEISRELGLSKSELIILGMILILILVVM